MLNREEWLHEKQFCLGASEWASVLGVPGAYDRPLGVYLSKVEGEDEKAEDWISYGRDVEGAIANMYARKANRLVKDLGATEIQYHEEYPFLGATLDRSQHELPVENGRHGPLELKSVGFGSPKIWQEDPPLHHQIQLQAQMACTGATWGTLAALFPGYQLVWKDFKRNDDFIDAAIPVLQEFWERVEARDPPPPQSSKCLAAVKRLYPEDTGETVEINPETAEDVVMWRAAKAAVKTAKDQVAELEARIRAEIGDATTGRMPSGDLVTLRTTTVEGYTNVVKPYSYRTLRFKEVKR
jgi:predicted phage-related endonuclease